MRIIHYIPSVDRNQGGTAAYMQLLASELGKIVDLQVVTHVSENPIELQNCKTNFISSSLFGGMKSEFLQILNDFNPDIVHVNCCWTPQCAYAQRIAQKAGYQVVITPHGMLEPWIVSRHYYTRKLPALLLYQRSAIRNAVALHATAEGEKENLLKLKLNDNIFIVPNGIEVEKIKMKQSWQRKKNILFLSRVHPKKGIELLLEAVSTLSHELEGYKINIAGEGEENYIAELKNKAEKLTIDDKIHFLGGVYGDRKWQLYREADLFVLPTYSENFGIVIAEALASGTPVITTKGTPWQELQTRNCGYWTDINATTITDALRDFLKKNIDEIETFGRNGRKLIEANYSSQAMATQLLNNYKQIIK